LPRLKKKRSSYYSEEFSDYDAYEDEEEESDGSENTIE